MRFAIPKRTWALLGVAVLMLALVAACGDDDDDDAAGGGATGAAPARSPASWTSRSRT